ncbi:MAG: adenylate/guanylate cyclase domain-containing protein, partial [Bacteroidota bacterium]
FILFRWRDNKSPQLPFKSNRLALLAQWALGVFFFMTFFSLFIAVYVSAEVAEAYTHTTSFISLLIYHAAWFLILMSVINVSNRLGGLHKIGVYLLRTFTAPRQLQSGFMFLDLNGSTQIAERLSSREYSLFLRQCFRLLDQVVEKYPGLDIYQYVGDEAIIHWNYNDDDKCIQAINLFYDFKIILSTFKTHFKARFHVQPTFKAAIHGGPVIKVELGTTQLHTAFHGDVLNTTSRILSLCHQNKTDLLISESSFEKLNSTYIRDSYNKIQDVFLNGKTQRLTVYKPKMSSMMINTTFL